MAKQKHTGDAPERIKQIRLANINIDNDLNPRAKGLDEGHLADLIEALEAGEELPPLVLYKSAGATLWLSEGFHRAEAYRRKGIKTVPCVVRTGERADALANACGSNRAHGLKRTNADKRRAVELLLKQFSNWSNRKIADAAGVDDKFVGSIKNAIHSDRYTAVKPQCTGQNEADQIATKNVEIPGENTDSAPETATEPEVTEEPEMTESEPDSVESDAPAESEPAEPEPEEPEAPATVAFVPPTQVDEWGIPVQEHARAAFAALPRFKELLAALAGAQRLFNEVANGPGGEFLRLPEVSSYRRGKKLGEGEYADRFVHEGLERAAAQVKNAVPQHTVCPYQYADAPHPEKCRCCLGLNWTPALSDDTPRVCVERAKTAFGVKEAA